MKRKLWVSLLAAVIFAMPAVAVWDGADRGADFNAPHLYLDEGNWVGNDIDDSFEGFAFTGVTTLFVTNNHVMAGPWDFSFSGLSYARLFLSSVDAVNVATPWEVTLGGDVTCVLSGSVEMAAPNPAVVINQPLRVNLGGADRTFAIGSAQVPCALQLFGINGAKDIIKEGAGTLQLSASTIANSGDFSGNVIVNEGTLAMGGEYALGTNLLAATTVTMNPGTILRSAGGWNNVVHDRRFIMNDAVITGGQSFGGILCADTPIVKVGADRFGFVAGGSNEFTHGFVVQEGSIHIEITPERLGPDIAGNDIIVTNGGMLMANSISGSRYASYVNILQNRSIILDTTDPTKLSGIGVGTTAPILPFTVRGDNPGMIYCGGSGTHPDPDDPDDADAIAALRAGWYLGGENYGYGGTNLPAGPDGNYRLVAGTIASYNSFSIGGTNALTGSGGVIVGSPTVPVFGGNVVRFDAPQDYTGKTLVINMTLALNNDGAATGTSEIRLRNVPAAMAANTAPTAPSLTISGTPPQGFIQRTPAAAPIIMESGQNRHIYASDAEMRVILNVVDGVATTNAIGPVTMLTGRCQFFHGFWNLADGQSFYVQTQTPSFTRKNRSVGFFGHSNTGKDVHTPQLGFWSTDGSKTRNGGNVFIVTDMGVTNHLVGGNGGTGYDAPIVPYLYAHDFNSAPANMGSGNANVVPVTYDTATGFRALRFVTDADGNAPELLTLAPIVNGYYDTAIVGENDNVTTSGAVIHTND
ncbi:MAG: hypothetical protein FWF84_06110, partial [Kiritimatiellaeota bacterium]|nr:hypothetical protein [Kiritimatiellota bacterium]